MRTEFSTAELYRAICEKEGEYWGYFWCIGGAVSMGERRRRVIDAAYELLASDGLEGLTIRSVLAGSGLARRAFYERFATKDDLVLAVFQQTLADAARYFAAQIAPLNGPIERLRHIVIGIVMGHGIAGGDHELVSGAPL